MLMRRAAVVLLLALLTIKGAGTAPSAEDITATNVLALEAWVAFVKGHTPGRRDAAARAVSLLSLDTRQALHPGLPLFLSRLKGEYSTARSAAQRRILEIAREAELTLGANAFLKRAAVLHADAAMSAGPRAWEPVEPGHAGAFRAPASPLLSDRTLFLDHDGEILGEVRANWNWPFARSLLDLVGPEAGGRSVRRGVVSRDDGVHVRERPVRRGQLPSRARRRRRPRRSADPLRSRLLPGDPGTAGQPGVC